MGPVSVRSRTVRGRMQCRNSSRSGARSTNDRLRALQRRVAENVNSAAERTEPRQDRSTHRLPASSSKVQFELARWGASDLCPALDSLLEWAAARPSSAIARKLANLVEGARNPPDLLLATADAQPKER